MSELRQIAERAADRIMHGVGTDCADCVEAAILDGTKSLRAKVARLTAELHVARKLCGKAADEMLAMSEPDHKKGCPACRELYRELRAEEGKSE